MNQTQSYMDMHSASHISTGPSYSHPATASAMTQYPHYHQTSVMPPSTAHYPTGPAFGGYGYGNPVTSPQSAGPLPSMMSNGNSQHYGPASGAPTTGYPSQSVPYDTTGQLAPPGMKPRVTATLWEDEGSLCFQVEAKGVCVARREDNHFINGTKLLNVAGMTRGRRDGILKSEKTRHVVKIGPMHLKGVWIPFERALEFANKEKITDQLYPLFVHNIGGLLYNPENATRANTAGQGTDRRRLDGPEPPRSAQGSQPPSLHTHHSMQNGTPTAVPPTPHSITAPGRPSLDRAHTFPTPPTSASSVMGIGNPGGTYDWNNSALTNGVGGNQPLSIDTGTGIGARSMPTTPATTPPGSNVPNMNTYQAHQGYESKQHYYTNTPSAQTGYPPQPATRYDSYGKTDMGPPTAPPSGSSDAHDAKSESYSAGHPSADATDHQENGYMTGSNGAYSRSYTYAHGTDHHNLSPEMTSSPSHQTTSGRGTPRTMPPAQTWSQDYQTPPRAPGSNLYSSLGDGRTTTSNDAYSAAAYPATGKRGRDNDEDDKLDPYKRQKIVRPDTFGMPLTPNMHMQAIKTGGGLPGPR